MVFDSVQASSIGKRTQETIDDMNAQLLPGGLGGVGSGFVAAQMRRTFNATAAMGPFIKYPGYTR